MKAALSIVALFAASVAQAQVYQCQINGRKVFTDQPCGADAKAVDVRPAAGPAPESALSDSAPGKTLSKRADDAVQKRFMDDDIYRKEQRIKALRDELDAHLAALKRKKTVANNNLAGAVWEQSISDEMIATTNAYGNKIRSAERDLADLKAQRAALDKP